MAYVPDNDVRALVDVILEEGMATDAHVRNIFVALPPPFVALRLPSEATPPGARLKEAFELLNDEPPFGDGSIGLITALELIVRWPTANVVAKAKQLLARVVVAAPLGTPTLDVALREKLLAGARVFAARERLRERLIELAQMNGPCALVINAIPAREIPADVGKSHTRHLLANASWRSRVFDLAWVEIEKEQAASYTPDWLIEDLVRSLVPAAAPLPERAAMPMARWLGTLASWALGQFATLGGARSIWMVVDGIRHNDIHPDVRALVARLAQRVGTRAGSQQLRLVLIDCDRTEIIKAGCTAEEEAIDHLTAAEGADCVQALNPDAYATKWPSAHAKLAAAGNLTTRLVSAAIHEALSP